jgi:nucleoside-diphosphate kinase
MPLEQTLVLLKPDALQRGLVGKVISRIEERGLQIVGMKMIKLDKQKCDEHYSHLVSKPFYPSLVSFMTSAPIIAIVVFGPNAIKVVRDMCGPTNAQNAPSGTIRGDFSLSTQYNIIHASDSAETAKKEIKRFFREQEIYKWGKILEGLTFSEDDAK